MTTEGGGDFPLLEDLEEEGKTLVLNGLQTTPATLNIVPNAIRRLPPCPCDLVDSSKRSTS
jgi:hypothetical protein